MEVGRAQSTQPCAEPRPSSCQLSGSGPLGDKPKVAWPLQAVLLPRAFSLSHSCFIFCHPKILLKYLSRITVGWRRIQVSTQNVIWFANLGLLPASTVGPSEPSRDPQGRDRPPGGGAGAPRPHQVRATGKVREWESQVRGGEEVHPCNSGARWANSGHADLTTQLPPLLAGCDTLGAPRASVPCARFPCARGLQWRPRPAAVRTPEGNFP